MSIRYLDLSGAVNFWTNIKNYILSKIPTKTSELTNDSGFLTQHQSLSNYVTLNTAQEITNTKTFKDATTVRKLTSVQAGNVIPSSDKLISDIWQDKNGKELGRIYYSKTKGGNTALIMRAGDWFTSNEGVYTLDASGTNRRAELHLYSDSSGNCCIKPVGYFSATLKPLDSSVCLAEYGKPFGVVYVNQVRFTNATLQVDVDITATEEHSIGFFGKNNGPLSYITFQKRPSFKDRVAIRVQTSSSAYKSYDFDATCFYPESSNSVDIGSTTNIFKNIYCNNYYKGTTAFGDIVTHNASEFLTSHPSITLSSNTTSTASPAHGGTFTCIDSVTQDTNGHITKVNTKTVTLPSNNNTDTKVKQYEGTTNNERPILSRYNSTEASQTANFVVYDTGVTSNPAKHTITASGGFVGNASSATKLNTARQINGTDFDGTSDITTAKWGTSRKIEIWDGQGVYKGTTLDIDGSSDIQLNLPTSIIADNFYGNATSATQFSTDTTVALTGDATGTSAGSKKGWSVPVTLANSGVTAGTYGPSADVTGSNNTTILVPEITVDAKGRVTSVTNRTYKSVNTDSDKKVYQYYKSDDNVYRLLFSNNSGNTATSNVGAVYSGLNNSFYVNPSTGSLYATKLYSGGTEVKVTDYDTHIADTDIHVTTADKNRWNNQTYVFRYSSTALTASSTNSNALLDNTDNLKVGDKVIDSSGVLFSITAIDTANSTFTIGTALIDLTQDSDVVHKSGNETADGLKTFLKYITSDGSSTGDEYSSNTRTNLWLMSNRDTEKVSGVLFDTYRQNAVQGKGIHVLGIGIKENSVRYEGCRFGWYWYNDLNGYSFDFKPTTAGANQALNHNLGTSYDKWDTINGINPGALSLPDLDNGIDISGFITGGNSHNEYTPIVDGWISVILKSTGGACGVFLYQGGMANGHYSSTSLFNEGEPCVMANLPVKAGTVVNIDSRYSKNNYVYSAKFYPCQGNV